MRIIDETFRAGKVFGVTLVEKFPSELVMGDRTTMFWSANGDSFNAVPILVDFHSWMNGENKSGEKTVHATWVEVSDSPDLGMFTVEYKNDETVAIIVPETI